MAGLSTAERNRNKRERKKREREEQRKLEQEKETTLNDAAKDKDAQAPDADQPQVEIEYVAEPVKMMMAGDGAGGDGDAFDALRRFQERADAIVISDDERGNAAASAVDGGDEDGDDDEYNESISKRRIRDMIRPSVAELKRRVERPDLVEAHDVTAADPEFLIQLKAVPGTVPVPRHWGRKRKYLQGKVRSALSCYISGCSIRSIAHPPVLVCYCMYALYTGPAKAFSQSFYSLKTERV
jgi:splicing factor 3B subunit 2